MSAFKGKKFIFLIHLRLINSSYLSSILNHIEQIVIGENHKIVIASRVFCGGNLNTIQRGPMNFSQTVLINKFRTYLKNRDREDFSSKLSPGYCHGLVLLFCYFANIKKVDRFYQLLADALKWEDYDDERILQRIALIKETPQWQIAQKEFKAIESQLKTSVDSVEQTYFDKINEAKKAKLISASSANILLSAILPDDPAMEKILGLVETLQRFNKYRGKFSSSGTKLELLRDIDLNSPFFTYAYQEESEFQDAIILPRDQLDEFFTKLPEGRTMVLGTGRHAFGIIKESNKQFILFDSNSPERLPDFSNSKELTNFLLRGIYKNLIGLSVPVSIEILAQENQDPKDASGDRIKDLKKFCDRYRKNEYAKFIVSGDPEYYPDDGLTPLIISLTAELKTSALSLIDQDIGIKDYDGLGFCPIHYAAYSGHTDIVNKLIEEKKVDINEPVHQCSEKLNSVSLSLHHSLRGLTPLFFACANNNVETATLLLNQGANIDAASVSGLTPLMCAIAQGNRALVNLLVSRGAKLDGNLHLLNNTQYSPGESNVMTALEYFGALYVPEYDGFNLVMLAAKRNQPQILIDLLKQGVNINYANADGLSLIHICTMNGILNQEILAFKPNVNSLVKLSKGSSLLVSPLWIACYKNDGDLVKLLLANGAKPIIQNINELSPLIKAVQQGDLEIIKLLIASGADINIKMEHASLLDIAIQEGHTHLVEFLIQNGVSPHEKTENIESTLDIAIKFSRFKKPQLETISHLLSWMIKNSLPIPESAALYASITDKMLITIYRSLTDGIFTSANHLCTGLIFMLGAYTPPSSPYSSFYSLDTSSDFNELSDQLRELANPSFSAFKDKIQTFADENKFTKDQKTFLQILVRLTNDFSLKPSPTIIPTATLPETTLKHE